MADIGGVMRSQAYLLGWFALTALLAGCGDDDKPTGAADMSAPDQVVADMAAPDLYTADLDTADLDAPDLIADMSAPDMAPDMPPIEDMPADMPADMGADMAAMGPLAGFGALTGDCRVLDSELTSVTPHLFAGAIDFAMDPYDAGDLMKLTPGGQYIAQTPNAGGNSVLSEVFAFEVLARCEDAKLLKTETEITYENPRGKITDILVEIDGLKIGVSVVRAIAFPFNDPYPITEAERILRSKLEGIALSSDNVTAQDRWVKQILSVIAYTPMHAQQIRQAWMALEPELRGDTVLYVTATEGDDRPIYNIP
jgi:hypothetical protein